jgi:GH24 family phage-related lysozyme (muramidase)
MKLSARGLALIAEFEGFVGHGYNDAGRHCTIGYGHLLHHGVCSRAELARTISRRAAKALLDRDVERFERTVDRLVRVSLGQAQFDALVSFTFNVGEGAFADSTLLRKLNRRDFDGAAAEFDRWTRSGGRVLPGLVRRRNVEQALFRARTYPHRWEGYTASERRWIEEYDRLLRARRNLSRRRVLRRVMRAQRKRIWRLAQPRSEGGDGGGWQESNRWARYSSLKARTS